MATIGQVAASIAHEVAQPIVATVANAAAALARLSAQLPDLDEVRSARALIVRNVNRAGAVIGRIRSLVRKEPPRWDSLEINDVIREVIGAHPWRSGEECHLADRGARRGIASYSRRSGPAATGMLNLIINAAEAMPGVDEASRELRINTERAEAAWTGAGGARAPVRCLLHNQTRKAWGWDRQSVLNHRGSWRAIMGDGEPRGRFLLHGPSSVWEQNVMGTSGWSAALHKGREFAPLRAGNGIATPSGLWHTLSAPRSGT